MRGSGRRVGPRGWFCTPTHGGLRFSAALAAALFFNVSADAQDIDVHPDMPAPVGVPSASPSDHPWTALGRIVSKAGFCGGVLIGEDRVLTAAHCLRDNGVWLDPTQLKFLAGFSHGRFHIESRVRTYAVADWDYRQSGKELGDWRDDWALLQLSMPLGRTLGTLPPTPVRERVVLAYGKDLFRYYHGTFGAFATPQFAIHPACILMRVYGETGVFLSDCPSRPGDSGSPLLLQHGAEFVMAGLYLGRAGNLGTAYTVVVSAEEILREMPRVEIQLSPPEGGGFSVAVPAPRREKKKPLDPTRWTPSQLFKYGGS